MRWLEVRRHSTRVKPDKHLSPQGVALARRVGRGMGPFDLVVASEKARAFETALAMGFAVHQRRAELNETGDAVEADAPWDAGFGGWAQAVARGGPAARFAHAQAAFWAEVAATLPDGGAALMLTHGGIIEAGTVAALPNADFAAWGGACALCEGVRLAWEGGHFVAGEALRVPVPAPEPDARDGPSMPLFRFDEDVATPIHAFGSEGLTMARLLEIRSGAAQAGVMHLAPGGRVGCHTTTTLQVFAVVQGSGWVRTEGMERTPIATGQAAVWEPGQEHEAGTKTGLTAIVIEADNMDVTAQRTG